MFPIKKKKNSSRNKLIARSFFVQLSWKILAWTGLGIGLAFLGGFFGNQEFISQDILGEIYQKLTKSKNQNLHEFFLGDGFTDRQKLLTYALIFLGIVIFLNIIITLSNLFFKINDHYIENNKFYIYNGWIFFLNTLTRIISYIVITLCFIGAQTLLLITLFIFLYSWFSAKKLNEPLTENFFTWQDPYVRKIFILSSLIIFLLAFLYDRGAKFFKTSFQETMGGDLSKTQDLIKRLFTLNPALQIIGELISNISNFALWIVLFWFIRGLILSRISEHNDFWAKVNSINKQAEEFKQFYYYQKLLSEANVTNTRPDLPAQTKKIIILGNYGFLQATPNFLKKEYLEEELNDPEQKILKEFSDKIKKIIEFIDFLPRYLNPTGRKESQQKKINFLVFCLFNEFQSFAEIEQTKRLILTKKLSYVQRVKKILPTKT